MSNYNFEMDLSENSSTGIIAKKIKPGSVVLEFGCATGRMTRYMKEQLGCQVYIVEIEIEAFEIARQYAVDGVCCNAMDFTWREKFGHVKFDCILFMDVLEHLTIPDKVLKSAAELLKEDGNVYVSIPNITHNDILLKAFDNHFDYTTVGILDETHVHFWGLENIKDLALQSGLFVQKIEGTYCETGFTEQFRDRHLNASTMLTNVLRERSCGDIYQFIISMCPKKDGISDEKKAADVVELRDRMIQSHVYLDKGNGFNEKDIMTFPAVNNGCGTYHFHCVLDNITDVKQLRFDPLENQNCILRNLSVKRAGKDIKYECPDGIDLVDGMLLNTIDPMVYIFTDSSQEAITIDADIIILSELYVEFLREGCIEKHQRLKQTDNEMKRLEDDNAQMNHDIDILQREKVSLVNEKEQLNRELDVMRAQKSSLEEEKISLQLCAAKEKEELLNQFKNEKNEWSAKWDKEKQEWTIRVEAYMQLVNLKDQLLISKDNELTQKDQVIHAYANRLEVRICNKIMRILRAIKCRIIH